MATTKRFPATYENVKFNACASGYQYKTPAGTYRASVPSGSHYVVTFEGRKVGAYTTGLAMSKAVFAHALKHCLFCSWCACNGVIDGAACAISETGKHELRWSDKADAIASSKRR